jgi:hypothetical protein
LLFKYLSSSVSAQTRFLEAAAFFAALLLYLFILWFLDRRFRRKLAQAFSRHHCAGPSFASISEALRDLNEDCAHFVFTAEQSANVLFRERRIALVYGHVGIRSPGGIRGPVWTLRKRVYAFVPNDEVEWMKANRGVFKLATSGYRFSIFWVDLNAFLAG